MRRLQADPAYLDRILREGAERAAATAEKVLGRAYDAVGFLRLG
jgi:tryptophanyl-tRNA synthetase